MSHLLYLKQDFLCGCDIRVQDVKEQDQNQPILNCTTSMHMLKLV